MSKTPTHLLKNLIKPKAFDAGIEEKNLREELKNYFGTEVFVLNSGRAAIYLALKALGISTGDQVLLQAYTCNAVPNPILWTGAIPVYVDIEEDTLNMSLEDLKKKITPESKAIIVQHTFGNPAKVREILKIAEEHNLKVIEDCAHSLGGKLDGKLLGTFGDLSIISFGREKVVSSLTGGALIVNDPSLKEVIEKEFETLKVLPKNKILQEIGNYFSWRLFFRRINGRAWGGNFIRYLYQFDQINVVTSRKELSGLRPNWYPSRLPDILAKIALLEFPKIDSYNEQREKVAKEYFEKVTNPDIKLIGPHSGIYLRVVGISPKAHKIFEENKKAKLNFGNWYNSVIYPEGVHLARLGYKSGSCPVAEKTAVQSFNLPNFIGMTQGQTTKVIDFLNSFS
ncbi:MAG TPA: aminotransferase class I/II-fold pyridoxal phosphate-dependent enzyme [Candidatus Saccharimonadales bacterium]|nr:aminotransferase class I/II-fold pyridoxal phosphate-dependent enzyme [Candidatus Saccharimonadales bacterium]